MPIEYEAKILDIDPDDITTVILAKGGMRAGHFLMRRLVYDIVAGERSRWIRLRDTGSEVTLTVKEVAHDGIDGTHETELTVGDFDTANELLRQIGFTPKSYQENLRTSFTLSGARLEIDTWPLIPPYLEIEAKSKEDVVRVAEILGLDKAQLTGENTTKVYTRYGIDLEAIADLRLPDSLRRDHS